VLKPPSNSPQPLTNNLTHRYAFPVGYQPQFTITPALLSRVEKIAALRERILAATVQVRWIPALQKDTRTRNTHSSTAIESNPLTLDHKSLTPREIWDALAVSKQGALDLLRPLIQAGLVRRIGTQKTGRYILA